MKKAPPCLVAERIVRMTWIWEKEKIVRSDIAWYSDEAQTILRKIEQDNRFIIQQNASDRETHCTARKNTLMRHFARFRTNLGNLRISQDICYVRMTDYTVVLTIYGNLREFVDIKRRISSFQWNNKTHKKSRCQEYLEGSRMWGKHNENEVRGNYFTL